MLDNVWLARDADGEANLYSLHTARPLLTPDGFATTNDEAAECLGAYLPEQAERLFGVTLAPGECVRGTLLFRPASPGTEMPVQRE